MIIIKTFDIPSKMHCQFISPKLVILLPVRVCSRFASSGVCPNANRKVITPKEQTGAESIVYSARTVIRSSSFKNPSFNKNQTAPEQTITTSKQKLREKNFMTLYCVPSGPQILLDGGLKKPTKKKK